MQIDTRARFHRLPQAVARFEVVRDVVDRVGASLATLDNAPCDEDRRQGHVAFKGELRCEGAELLESRGGYQYRGTSLHTVDGESRCRTRPANRELGWLGPLTHSTTFLRLTTDGGNEGSKAAGEYTYRREKGLPTWTFQPVGGPVETYTLRGGVLTVT